MRQSLGKAIAEQHCASIQHADLQGHIDWKTSWGKLESLPSSLQLQLTAAKSTKARLEPGAIPVEDIKGKEQHVRDNGDGQVGLEVQPNHWLPHHELPKLSIESLNTLKGSVT